MLKNYIKIAWKVLLRRKFFTFISLFGISFTLMVLIVAASFANHLFGTHAPELKSDRLLYVSSLKMAKENSTFKTQPGYYFLNKYVRPLKTPEDMTFYTQEHAYNVFINNRKLGLELRYTDSNYWNVLDFNFLEGGPFSKADVESAGRVAVISEATRINYFGEGRATIGKFIEIDRTKYKVVGVVDNIYSTRIFTYADVWVPYTNIKEDLQEQRLGGSFQAILLAKSAGDLKAVKQEFNAAVRTAVIPAKHAAHYEELYVHADTLLESFVRGLYQLDGEVNLLLFSTLVFIGMVLFMLLPTINLININISRIMDRASEIGVRKAFGASSTTLVMQFLLENIVLTLLGGVIGLLLAQGVLVLINGSGIIPNINLQVNHAIFFYSLLICLFFGIMSGVYPAFKMSKLPVVVALKGGIV